MHELFSLEDVFNVMIELETLGNTHYLEMEKMTKDYQLKELFSSLAKQELAHRELYTQYKNAHISFESNQISQEYKEYMDSLLFGTIEFLKSSQKINDFEHGFSIAIQLEKDTILFLGEIKGIIEPSYYDAMDAVLNQERNHLKALYKWQSMQQSSI